ncbi:uncharacterized protein [Macrobrachium rosenbergii]|uniref:uncharacterized protein n=1 Tax=Macrobrachium rosenbergii TaxID=79674 RepID=UPI0034D42D20
MAENTSTAQTVPNIKRATKRFNEQVNYGYWIDRNQARYIDQELFIDSSSWILKSDHSQPNDSAHMTTKVNYWRLPGEHLNFPSHPNQCLDQYHAERCNVQRTIDGRKNEISPGDIATNKRAKTNIIPQQICGPQGENRKIGIRDLIEPDITKAPQTLTNEKQGEQTTHPSHERCSKSCTKTISRPKETPLRGSNEDSLELNHNSYHAWSDKSNPNSEMKLNEAYIENLNHFMRPALPVPSKVYNNLQDPNTSSAFQEDTSKAVAARCPEYTEKSPASFPAKKQDKVLPVAGNLLPGSWQIEFPSNLPCSELESVVTASVDTVQPREFKIQKSVNFLNLQSATYKDGILCDDTLMTSTVAATRLQTNNITASTASGSESWFKLLSQETHVSNTDKDQAQATENMQKLKELRQGFRGAYSKMNFSKSSDHDPKSPPNGTYSEELGKNLESAAGIKLSGHNQRHKENANEMKTIHVDLGIEAKIKRLLQNSLQTKILRKNQKLLNAVPKSNTGATKKDAITASTSNASVQYETTVPGSSQVPTYFKSPGNVRSGKDARQKYVRNPLKIIRMEIPNEKKQLFLSLCKKHPGLISYLSHLALRKNPKARNEKLQSELKLIQPKETGPEGLQSPYTMEDRILSPSKNNVLLAESASNSITNQITVTNAGVQKMAHSQENKTASHVTGIQQKANSALDHESEKSSFGQNTIKPVNYQPSTSATEYQILVNNSCDQLMLKPTDNSGQVINTAECPAEMNTVDLHVTRDSTAFQPIINKTDQPTRNTFENQPVTVPVMDNLQTNFENDEAKAANAIGGRENSVTEKFQHLKHFEQLLKMEYDRYIENKLKLLQADTHKRENSGQGGRKSAEKKDDDDVLVIDYFDVDSFIEMETTG